MKPMAKLYINRQRIYEKICEDMPANRSNSGGRHNKNKKHDKNPVPSKYFLFLYYNLLTHFGIQVR